jgi:hypothetical protein
MIYPGRLLSKTLVIGIIILFIGMSVVSSTDNLLKESPDDWSPLESVHSIGEKFLFNTTCYMFIASGYPEGQFYVIYPNGTVRFSEWVEEGYFSGGTWTNDGRYLCCLYENGTLYDIDLETLDACAIGDGGVSLNGLAYDPVYEKLYGASCSDLYEIDMTTGEQTHIGSFGIANCMIAIACNIDGVCYGWDVLFSGDSTLYTIDLDTGEATEVFSLGENLVYAQDGSFDYSTDTLYLTAYSSVAFLAYVDFDAEELVHICNLQYETTALAISYEYDITPPVTTHTLDPPEPDGENGWYVSDVTVTLNATDDWFGVKEIRYTMHGGAEQIIYGDSGTFILTDDGHNIVVDYWAIDNAENVESKKTILPLIDIDQKPPETSLCYEIVRGNWWQGWDYGFLFIATDELSGVNVTYYQINGGEWVIYTEPFTFSKDEDNILIEHYSVDYAGNVEDAKSVNIPRNRSKYYPLFQLLFDRFPFLEVFLRAMNLLR